MSVKNKKENKCGVKILTESLKIFKKYGYFSKPKSLLSIWFGVSYDLIETVLLNTLEYNLDKFKERKTDIILLIKKLEAKLSEIKSKSKDIYG